MLRPQQALTAAGIERHPDTISDHALDHALLALEVATAQHLTLHALKDAWYLEAKAQADTLANELVRVERMAT